MGKFGSGLPFTDSLSESCSMTAFRPSGFQKVAAIHDSSVVTEDYYPVLNW